MLLNIVLRTTSTTKNYSDPNGDSAESEKPWQSLNFYMESLIFCLKNYLKHFLQCRSSRNKFSPLLFFLKKGFICLHFRKVFQLSILIQNYILIMVLFYHLEETVPLSSGLHHFHFLTYVRLFSEAFKIFCQWFKLFDYDILQ